VLRFEESNVKPETGYKFINEFQYKRNKNAHLLTVYSHYINNYVFDRPLGVLGTFRGPTPAFIFDQANSFFAGFDYTWQTEWSDHFSGTLGANYLWSRNLSDNEPLINQPPIAISYGLDWKHTNFWKFDTSIISLKPSYTFKQFQAPRTIRPENLIDGSIPLNPNAEIFDFVAAPDGYFLLDFSWRVKWKQFQAGLTVTNLFNTSYRNYLNQLRYFADDPGINILFNLSYSFQLKKDSSI